MENDRLKVEYILPYNLRGRRIHALHDVVNYLHDRSEVSIVHNTKDTILINVSNRDHNGCHLREMYK